MFPQSMLLSHISYVVSYFMDIVVLFPHVSFASRHYCRHEPAIYSPIYMFLSFFFFKLFSLGRGKLTTGNLDRYLLDRIKIEKKSTSNRHQKPTAYLYNTCVHLKKLNYNCRQCMFILAKNYSVLERKNNIKPNFWLINNQNILSTLLVVRTCHTDAVLRDWLNCKSQICLTSENFRLGLEAQECLQAEVCI